NIIVLSENDDDEMKEPEETPEVTTEVEKEGPRTEPPSLTNSSAKEILEVPFISPLETTVVHTLSVMSSLAL
ncbi:hypothetical protein KI387_023752, partial [Taxus chinensis]